MADAQGLDPKKLREAYDLYKDIVQFSGDLTTNTKRTIDELKKVANFIEDINAKYEAISDTQINSKKLEADIERALGRRAVAQNRLATINEAIQKSADEKLKKEDDLLQKIEKKESQIAKNATATRLKKLADLTAELDFHRRSVTAQEAEYIASKKVTDNMNEQAAVLQGLLKTENMVVKQMGVSGNLVGILAKKLGVGDEAYGKMVQKSRDLVKNQNEVTNPGKWKVALVGLRSIGSEFLKSFGDPAVWAVGLAKLFSAVKKTGSAIASELKNGMKALTPEGGSPISDLTSGFSNVLKTIPLIGGVLGGLVDTFSMFLDIVVNSVSQVQKMGREMGLSADEALKLNKYYSDFATNSNNVFVTSRKMFETQIELGKQLGVMNGLSNDRLETDIMLKNVAGLELTERTGLVEASVLQNRNQKEIIKGVFTQVAALRLAKGIQLDQKGVLKEASTYGGYLGLSFAKYPEKLTKALVTAKSLGTSLKEMDSIADSFLDFESSISSQFEAQLLTGRDLNLETARNLFLNNDLAGAAQEINKQVGSSTDFMKLNRIQAESISKAFGMTRDQMADMLKKQEYMRIIGAKQTDDYREQYNLAIKKYKTQEAMAAAMGDEAANAVISGAANEKIAAFIDKIKQSFADLVSSSGVGAFIDKAINFLSQPDSLKKIVGGIQDFFVKVLDVTGAILGGIMRFLNYFPGINIDEGMINMVEGAGAQLKGVSLGGLSTPTSGISSMSAANAAGSTAMTTSPSAAASAGGPVVVQNELTIIQKQEDGATTRSTIRGLSDQQSADNINTSRYSRTLTTG